MIGLTMSYSYMEVFPYLFATSWADDLRCIFNPDLELFDDDTYDKEYDYYIEETYSQYSLGVIEVKIPSFKGIHHDTQEERNFEANNFSISTKFIKNTLHDSSDGMSTYSEFYKITDTKTKEAFNLEFYYVSSDYPHLTSITITPVEKKVKKPKKVKTQFVIVEQIPKAYVMHGVFTKLDKAIDGIQMLKESNTIISSSNKCVIEEIPQDTALIYNTDNEGNDFFLHSAMNQYNIIGEMINK